MSQATYQVAIAQGDDLRYPMMPPFHPAVSHPELPAAIRDAATSTGSNGVYDAVRETFRLLDLDATRAGAAGWNPLAAYVTPGSNVVIKPNLVSHETGKLAGANCLITHGSVIRAVVDYVYIALRGHGRIAIADASMQSARFDRMLEDTGINAIRQFYREALDFEIDVIDLRQTVAIKDDSIGLILEQRALPGDPRGYTVFNLKNESAYEGPGAENVDPSRFGVTDYAAADTRARHERGRHEYVVARTILEADTIIAIPKLKVHEKVGLTACLKGMVGVIGSKDCLPHFRVGSPRQHGDEFTDEGKRLASAWTRVRNVAQARAPVWAWRLLRAGGKTFTRMVLATKHAVSRSETPRLTKPIIGGAWYGNDTAWRMVADLNRIVRNGTVDGVITDSQQRRFFGVVDAVIAGENMGPLAPDPHHIGAIVAGDNAWTVDRACAALVGFDVNALRILQDSAWLDGRSAAEAESMIDVRSNRPEFSSLDGLRHNAIRVQPPPGWVGHIEDRIASVAGSRDVA